MQTIIKELSKSIKELTQKQELDTNLAQVIEQVFNESNNIEYLRNILIRKLTTHLTNIKPEEDKNQTVDEREKVEKDKILTEVEKFVDNAIEMQGLHKQKYFNADNIKSRQNLKKLVRSFAVYQIYQMMNPRRIAGETKKMNYINNLILFFTRRFASYIIKSKNAKII